MFLVFDIQDLRAVVYLREYFRRWKCSYATASTTPWVCCINFLAYLGRAVVVGPDEPVG